MNIEKSRLLSGNNLKRFRLLMGWKQQQVADEIGITRLAYVNIESGKADPRPATLQRLLEVLHMTPKDYVRETPCLQSIYFRTNKARNLQEMAACGQTVDVAVERLNNYVFLEELEHENIDDQTNHFGMWERRKGEDCKEVARRVRKDIFGTDDVRLPALIPALESYGIKVIPFIFPARHTFGFSIGKADGGPAIVVNDSPDISAERKLFTLAHELGHLVLHSSRYGDGYGELEDVTIENEANSFASELLMPDDLFKKAWQETDGFGWLSHILQVKAIFHVSYQTVLHRLLENESPKTRTVYYNRFREMYRLRFGTELGPKDEPLGIRFRPEAIRYRRLARKAFMRGDVSQSRLAELLDKDTFEVRSLIRDWYEEDRKVK